MKYFLFILVLICSFSVSSEEYEKFKINFQYCDDEIITEDFLYPVNIKQMTKVGNNKDIDYYKIDFFIDPNFKFPKTKREEQHIPYISDKIIISCYNDSIPDYTSYLYMSNDKNNKIDIYFNKEKDIFSFIIYYAK